MAEVLKSSSGNNELETVDLIRECRTGSVIGDSKSIIYPVKSILNEFAPFSPDGPTLRHIYYKLRGRGLIKVRDNDNKSVKKAYCAFIKLMVRARENKDIDWKRISDRSRTPMYDSREVRSLDGIEEYLDSKFKELTGDTYFRSFWRDQPKYVEVWFEKDAMTLLFRDAARPTRVTLLPCRENNSFTQVMDALWKRFSNLKGRGKEIVILYFGDLDPSGWNMTNDLQDRFDRYSRNWQRELGQKINVTVKRIGLHKHQVEDKPSEILKGKKDSNIKKYQREVDPLKTWELDVLESFEIREMLSDALWREINSRVWSYTKHQEEREKRALQEALDHHQGRLVEIRDSVKAEVSEILRRNLGDNLA